MPRPAVATLALALALVACAPARPDPGPGRVHNLITADEIEATGAGTAYQVIARLRGDFLTSRGPSSVAANVAREPTVYVDNAPVGQLQALHNISARDIATIRLLRAADAAQKYGNNHVGGVIEIATKH
jgi:hypothetical protein